MTSSRLEIDRRAVTELDDQLEIDSRISSFDSATGEHRSLYVAVTSQCCAQQMSIVRQPISQSVHCVATQATLSNFSMYYYTLITQRACNWWAVRWHARRVLKISHCCTRVKSHIAAGQQISHVHISIGR